MNAEELRRREDELFAEWKTVPGVEHSMFIKDGVVDPDTYLEMKPKVMFLAREPHWEKPGVYDDMRRYLNEGVDWPRWHVIARWTRALTTSEHVPWTDVDDEANRDFKNKELRKIAFVNIKKQGGGASVKREELIAYTKACGDLVKRQIEMYKPDVIVCTGTIWLLERFILPHTVREARRWTENDVVWFPLKDWPCAVIEMLHFTARKAHKEMYERLVNAWDEIREIVKWG